MKPTISVIVVRTTDPARAGSIPIFFMIMGSSAPAQAAMIRLITMATLITMPMLTSLNHNPAVMPITVAHNNPLMAPTDSSLNSR